MLEIAAIVAALEARLEDGRHRHVPVTSQAPMQMIEEAVDRLHYLEFIDEFDYVENWPEMPTDEKTAGTLSAAAVDEALAQFPETLAALREAGAQFGFDGYWQNGCAAPTPFLLVLDRAELTVHGVDLQPCYE